jgi:hypothetical protein
MERGWMYIGGSMHPFLQVGLMVPYVRHGYSDGKACGLVVSRPEPQSLQALDLGLNRNSGVRQTDGHDIFSVEEKQARQQLWWACCIADK